MTTSRFTPAVFLGKTVLLIGVLMMGFCVHDLQAQGLTITTSSLPNGTVGVAYSATVSATGGIPPYTWSAASLPPGLLIELLTGNISGTPTSAGPFSPTVTVRDLLLSTDSKGFSMTVVTALSVTTASLPSGTVGTPYSQSLTATGGTTPYTWSIVSGSLPAGLTRSGATIGGTPTAAGTSNFTVQVADTETQTNQRALSISVNPAALTITTASLPAGTAGSAYSQGLAATGGTPPYTWSIVSGSLPAGLTRSGATISGTPTTAGTSNFTVQVADSATPAQTNQRPLSISVSPPPLTITTSSLPAGTVGSAYSQGLAATGGTPPYTWSIVSGSLPAGLTRSEATISGIPTTAGTSNFTVQVADSATPAQTNQRALSITVSPPPLTITTESLPVGTVGSAYSQGLAATGGTPPYTWSIVSGSLPAGLTRSGAAISGTPTAAGTSNFTVRVADSATPARTSQLALSITVNPAALTITTTSLRTGTVDAPYSQNLAASGGTPPYRWSIVSGDLPPGLALSGAAIDGIPSTTGTSSFTVRVTDNGTPTPQVTQRALSITVNPPSLLIATTSLPAASVGAVYSQTLGASGGTPGYAWSIVAGSLPPGLTLNGATISGMPSSVGTSNFTVQVTDNGIPEQTSQRALSISTYQVLTVTTPSLPPGAVGSSYFQSLAAAGGVPPYTWSIAAGPLPEGLTLNGAAISGTPIAVSTTNFTVRVVDSSNPQQSAQKVLAFTAFPALSIVTESTLPSGTVGAAYSQTLAATGGVPGHRWTLASGSFPEGLTLANSGLISGTPGRDGVYIFTARVSDGSNGPPVSRTFTISIVAAGFLTITTPTLNNGIQGYAYVQPLTATGGTPPYSWSVVNGALPAGLSLISGGLLEGTPSSAGLSNFTVRVTESQGATATRDFTIAVGPPVPTLSLTGFPNAVNPTLQLPVVFSLSAAYPNPLSGTLTISFSSMAVVPIDDPAVRFSTGSRTVDFTIPANSMTAVLPAQLMLLTGTVAGTVTVTANIQNGPTGLPILSSTVSPLAPQMSNITAVRTAGDLRIQVTGYSPERRVTSVVFAFDVRTLGGTQRVNLERNVEPDFNNWYLSPGSSVFGSAFVFEQLFNVQGDSSMIESVTVTLRNAQGSTASSPVTIMAN